MKNFIHFICNCFYLFFLLSFLGCSGCGSSGYGNSNNDIYISDEITDNDVLDGRGGYDDENSDRSDIGNIRLTGRIETMDGFRWSIRTGGCSVQHTTGRLF